jgi:hypothetical protein
MNVIRIDSCHRTQTLNDKVSKRFSIEACEFELTSRLQDAEEHENKLDFLLKDSHQYGADDSASSNAETDREQINPSLAEGSTINSIYLDRPEYYYWDV